MSMSKEVEFDVLMCALKEAERQVETIKGAAGVYPAGHLAELEKAARKAHLEIWEKRAVRLQTAIEEVVATFAEEQAQIAALWTPP